MKKILFMLSIFTIVLPIFTFGTNIIKEEGTKIWVLKYLMIPSYLCITILVTIMPVTTMPVTTPFPERELEQRRLYTKYYFCKCGRNVDFEDTYILYSYKKLYKGETQMINNELKVNALVKQ